MADAMIAEDSGRFGVALESPEAGPKATTSLTARRAPLASPAAQLSLLDSVHMPRRDGTEADFEAELVAHGWDGLFPAELEVFQVNLGRLCNMTCRHCHVDAGPDRTDAVMSRPTVEACLAALDRTEAHTVDITGGAPELNPDFTYLVEQTTGRGKHVVERCNLTVLLLPKFADLPRWLAEHGVAVVGSLPHCRERSTDAQRGESTFGKSLEALRRLNAVGYGTGDPRLRLTLMTNPAGAFVSGDQAEMEREWKATLEREHGVTFDRLIALNNMPIARFLDWLVESGNLEPYVNRLLERFNPAAIAGLMCRNSISVSWDGRIFDCDFNQMLEIEAEAPQGRRAHIGEFDPEHFAQRRIRTARHCFGCTAGAGSSCAGATAA